MEKIIIVKKNILEFFKKKLKEVEIYLYKNEDKQFYKYYDQKIKRFS